MKIIPLVPALGLVALLQSGCADISYVDRSYLYRPRVIERANPALAKNPDVMPATITMPNDGHVLVFVNDVTNVFRGNLNLSIAMRHFSSVTQVLTAAAAATLTTLSPGSKNAITILAASSALMPQFQGIFDAKGRATAYQEGRLAGVGRRGAGRISGG